SEVGQPPAAAAPQPAKAEPRGGESEQSSSQKALLEALQKRREMLDSRASDLELRENLLKAAERRLEERLEELKRVETSVADVDRKRADEEKARLKNLVTMYESMKVKEAARIFEKLDPAVLLDVASLMNPRRLSEIMGQMSPDGAQKLTVALARQEVGARPTDLVARELPKIEGLPTPP
ncbi:MotE family protein, partial [Hansschlegelia beijingensis]